jgi:HK97 gp10 family phage protein
MPVPQMRFRMLDDPIRRMESLKQGMQNTILRKAIRAGAKSPREAAKRMAPRDSGLLARSISVRIGTNRKTGAVYAVVGPKRGVIARKKAGALLPGRPSKYAHLVEFGTRPHSLASGDKLARRTQAGRQASGGRRHPGAKPHPFLAPAWRTTAMVAREDMRRVVEEEVAKKLAKRPKR